MFRGKANKEENFATIQHFKDKLWVTGLWAAPSDGIVDDEETREGVTVTPWMTNESGCLEQFYANNLTNYAHNGGGFCAALSVFACKKSSYCVGRKVEIIPGHGIIYSRFNATGHKHGTTVIIDYKENSKTEIIFKNGVC